MLLKHGQKSKNFIYDPWLLLLAGALAVIGLIMVASASIVVSDQHFGTPFHFLIHQLAYILLGMSLAFLLSNVPLRVWKAHSFWILSSAILLLVLVLIPGLGRQLNGSVRWLGFGGIGIEVSEFAKFAVIIYTAAYAVRYHAEMRNSFEVFLRFLVILGIFAFLLLLEPDYGATLVITATVLGILFIGGARLREFIIIVALAGLAFAALAFLSPYRLARLTAFLNPWARPFDSGYQLTQSLIAFGRGGFWGVGLGNSIQKLFYLPEAHTDFLFAVMAEEFGIIGQLAVLAVFTGFVTRAFYLSRLAAEKLHNHFASYVAFGIGLICSLQVIINIGVNMGLLPTKGLTLPFVSYGGSSMLASFAYLAILLRIYHEASIDEIERLDPGRI